MPSGRETKVGVLFFVVLVSLFSLTVFIGDIQLFKEHFFLTGEFDEAKGLQEGDDVRLSGVKVGKVDAIRFVDGGIIHARLKIEDGPFKIHDNATLFITETTPLGGHHIEIIPPPRGQEGKALKRDGTARMAGAPPRGISQAVEDAAKKVGSVADTAQDVLTRNEGALGKIINDKVMGDDLKGTVQNLRETTDKINRGQGPLGMLVNDEEIARDLRQAIRNINEITRKINEGEGALGKLVSDKEIGKKVEQMVDSGNETFKNLKRTFSMRTFIGLDADNVPERDTLYSKIYLRIEPDDTKYYHVGAAILDIERSSPYNTPKRLSKLAADDDEIEVKAEVMLGWRFFERQISFGVGLLEGEPGGTLHLAPRTLQQKGKLIEQVWFTIEARSPFDDSELDERIESSFMARLKAGLDIRFGENIPVLKLHAGVDNMLDDPVYSAGIGVELEDKDLKNLVGLMGAAF